MNFRGNFRHIADVDVGDLRSLVTGITAEQWGAYAVRQQRYEAHRDTQTIGLVFDADFRHSRPTRLAALEVFKDAIRPALEIAAEFHEGSEIGRLLTKRHGLGYFVRATLVKLKAGGNIAPHQDNNFSLAHSHRLHLPVVTNEQVRFTVGRERLSLPAGALYEINNRRIHSVENGSREDRVHLILDFVLPGEQCCCGTKLHPQIPCGPQACLATDRLQIPCTCYPEE